MNASQLRSKVPLANQGTEADHETSEDQETATDSQSGSIRRKLALGAVVLGVGLYVRRRRSQTGDSETDATADEDGTGSESDPEEAAETEPDTEESAKQGGGISRRIKMMVVSTLVFALARRIVRRFKSSR